MKPLLHSLLLLALPLALLAEKPAPRNVVLIFSDDLGNADMTPFGAPAGETPHLDWLAREGRKFSRFYVASPVCTASRRRCSPGATRAVSGCTAP